MRRFLLRNAGGEQMGEGVQFSNGQVRISLPAFHVANLEELERWRATARASIDWLDPEPRKPYTDPVPGIAVIDGKHIPGELVAGADGMPVFRLGPLADKLKG